jgi:hypothetical protein
MAEERQTLLREAWAGGKKGSLSALAEAKAWALREVWRQDRKTEYGMLEFIRLRVRKVKGGNPSAPALYQFFERVDGDRDWFPGKRAQTQYGPDPVLTGVKRRAIATCAMQMKTAGQEPTYALVRAACPKATINPDTGRPVDKKRVYDIFREDCRDEGGAACWEHQPRYSKTAITAPMMVKRLAFALHVHSWGHTALWYHNHVVWTDICNSILPRTEAKASAQALARKGARGWVSNGCELYCCNLRGKKEDIKQNSWGTIKVWWAPILMRGKLHVEVFNDDYAGETEGGAETLVARVRGAVNRRFQGEAVKPDFLMVDRGRGFYNIQTGKITAKYGQAVAQHGFTNMMGDVASVQPGHMQEVLLHETAVAWIRWRLTKTLPRECWLETPAEYETRIKQVVQDINANCDVQGLCNNLPQRLRDVIAAEGGRLSY